MKKVLLFFTVLFCFAMQGKAAETLSFKMTNPSIYYESTINYLKFDVMVKASAEGTYLYGSQIICNVTLTAYNTLTPIFFELASGFQDSYDPPGPTPSALKYAVTTTWLNDKINIAVLHKVDFDSYYPASYTAVPNTYVKFGTVYVELKSGAAGYSSMAGISFLQGSMDGYQYYATGVAPWSANYESPNVYEGNDFTELYHGRMYSSGSGWTQYGGTMDWTIYRNTSVWDTASSAATITGTVAGTECRASALRIHAGARLKIDKDHPLTCNSSTYINNERGLWITSDASGTGSFKDNGSTVTYTNGGTTLVERYLTNTGGGNQWHLVSSPISDGLSGIFLSDYLMKYTEPLHSYEYIVPTNVVLDPMKGFATWVNSTSTKYFNGAQNVNSKSISVSRTYNGSTSDYDGWNLVGNPFPCSVDLSAVTASWVNVEATAWFWDPAAGNYKVYPSGGGGTHTQYAPPMQGFFVHCNDASATPSTPGSGTVAITIASRVHNSETFLKEEEYIPDHLTMEVSGTTSSYSDILSLYFNPDRTIDYEPGYDALKYSGQEEAPQIYTISGNEKLTVHALSFYTQNIVIPMGFSVGVDGEYTLNAGNLDSFDENISVKLEDLKLQKIQDLKVNPVYDLTYHTGDDPNRFLLHFGNPYLGSDGVTVKDPVSVFAFDDAVYVRFGNPQSVSGSIVIYDLLGRKVYQNKLQNISLNKFVPGLLRGNYVVSVISAEGTINTKVYLQ